MANRRGRSSPLCLHTPISIGRFAESVGRVEGGRLDSQPPKLIEGPPHHEEKGETKRSRWGRGSHRGGFLDNEKRGERVKEREMWWEVWQPVWMQPCWTGQISSYLFRGTESKLREASKKKQEISRPLNRSPPLTTPPSPNPPLFFSPISIPQGGWVTASLIERQINKEIYCHLCAPPS